MAGRREGARNDQRLVSTALGGHGGGVKVEIGAAQQVLLHLAHAVARQLVDEQHPFGPLEFSQTLGQGVANRVFRQRGRGLLDHNRRDALAEIRMWHADDS